MRVKFTQAARKHRIGRTRALHVMNTTEPTESQRDDATRELAWVGLDDRGLELEVVAIEIDDATTGERILLVLHVMPTALRE